VFPVTQEFLSEGGLSLSLESLAKLPSQHLKKQLAANIAASIRICQEESPTNLPRTTVNFSG
jgi:hypothetical protein